MRQKTLRDSETRLRVRAARRERVYDVQLRQELPHVGAEAWQPDGLWCPPSEHLSVRTRCSLLPEELLRDAIKPPVGGFQAAKRTKLETRVRNSAAATNSRENQAVTDSTLKACWGFEQSPRRLTAPGTNEDGAATCCHMVNKRRIHFMPTDLFIVDYSQLV